MWLLPADGTCMPVVCGSRLLVVCELHLSVCAPCWHLRVCSLRLAVVLLYVSSWHSSVCGLYLAIMWLSESVIYCMVRICLSVVCGLHMSVSVRTWYLCGCGQWIAPVCLWFVADNCEYAGTWSFYGLGQHLPVSSWTLAWVVAGTCLSVAKNVPVCGVWPAFYSNHTHSTVYYCEVWLATNGPIFHHPTPDPITNATSSTSSHSNKEGRNEGRK